MEGKMKIIFINDIASSYCKADKKIIKKAANYKISQKSFNETKINICIQYTSILPYVKFRKNFPQCAKISTKF